MTMNTLELFNQLHETSDHWQKVLDDSRVSGDEQAECIAAGWLSALAWFRVHLLEFDDQPRRWDVFIAGCILGFFVATTVYVIVSW